MRFTVEKVKHLPATNVPRSSGTAAVVLSAVSSPVKVLAQSAVGIGDDWRYVNKRQRVTVSCYSVDVMLRHSITVCI